MPSFDILSEVENQEIDNALNQARKELATRFDLKDAKTEIVQEKDNIVLIADDASHLKALREIVIGKLSKRGVDLRNLKQEEPAVSSVGHARQKSKLKKVWKAIKPKRSFKPLRCKILKYKGNYKNDQYRMKEKRRTKTHSVFSY